VLRGRSIATMGVTPSLFGLALGAHAAEPANAPTDAAPTYSLSWVRGDGADSCPAGRVLAAEVERRLGRKVFDAAAERSFEVEVVRVGERFKSDVYVRDAAGAVMGHRSLQGDEPGCATLLGATALAIALVIDPEAAARAPAASATFDAPPAPESPPPAPAPVPAKPETVTVTRVERVIVREPRALVTASLRGLIAGALVPRVSPGLELALGVRPDERWGVCLSAAYVSPQNASVGAGSFDVGLTRANVLGTFDLSRSGPVRWVLGAGAALGALHLAVREPAPVLDAGDFAWWSLVLESSLQVSVTKGVFVELGAGLHAPLLRQEFLARGQAEPVWRQSPVAGSGFVGVGAQFP
jgi:hypothetical protein